MWSEQEEDWITSAARGDRGLGQVVRFALVSILALDSANYCPV